MDLGAVQDEKCLCFVSWRNFCYNSHDTSALYNEMFKRTVICLHTVNKIKQEEGKVSVWLNVSSDIKDIQYWRTE
jgi:hypothetical protein